MNRICPAVGATKVISLIVGTLPTRMNFPVEGEATEIVRSVGVCPTYSHFPGEGCFTFAVVGT